MAWTPVTDNQLQSDVDTLKAKRGQYMTAVTNRDAAAADLAAKQAIVDQKKAELIAAASAVESDAVSYKADLP